MAEEKLRIEELENVPVSGGSDVDGSRRRIDENVGLSETEMQDATGGLGASTRATHRSLRTRGFAEDDVL